MYQLKQRLKYYQLIGLAIIILAGIIYAANYIINYIINLLN